MESVKRAQPQPQLFDTRLHRLLARARRRVLGWGLVRWGATGGAMLLASVWVLGGEHGPGSFNGWGLTLSLLAGLGSLGWHLVARPWRAIATPARLAARIECEAGFANLVVAAEEAGRLPGRWPDTDPIAAELKRRLYERATAVLDLVSARAILPLRFGRLATTGLAVTALLTAAYVGWSPDSARRGWGRLWQPVPPGTGLVTGGLYAAAGPEYVVVGGEVELVGLDFAGGDGAAAAEVLVGNGTWQVLPTRESRPDTLPPGVAGPYRRWLAQASEVREDFVWRYRRGTLVSSPRRVTVRHYPLLTRLAAQIVPPAYTGLPAREVPHLPSWSEVPVGSRVFLSGQVIHPVRTAMLLAGPADSLALAVDSLQFSGQVTVEADLGFVVRLTDEFGLTNHNPLAYELVAVPDLPPGVNLERPDDDGTLPISGELNLITAAADDYGLAELWLLTRTGAPQALNAHAGEQWFGGRFWPGAEAAPGTWLEFATAAGPLRLRATPLDAGSSGLQVRYGLEVRADGLDLVAGDALELVVEAVDNKRPLPAGRTRSGVLRLTLPAAAEVLVSQSEANEERKSELEELRQRSQSLNADLDRLNRELLKNPVPDWARQQEMTAAIARQQKLQEELARVAELLRQELEKLAASQLASEAQLRKAEEMGELLSPGASEQLNQLLQKMEEGGGQASPEDMARAMDEVARNQQDMARRLDAALAMLKRMAQEQELDGLTALLEQMIQKQQELADLSRQLEKQQLAAAEPKDEKSSAGEPDAEPKDGQQQDGQKQDGQKQDGQKQDGQKQDGQPQPTPSAEELARRQAALEKELEQLQEKLEQALANLQQENENRPEQDTPPESSQDLAEALEKALEQVKQQQQEGKMGKAGEELQQMDPSEAAKMQEQALRDLGALYSVLVKSQQAMQQAMKMEQVGSLRGLAADLLALSGRQESIAQDIPPQLRDLRALDLTRSQHRLQKSALGVRAGLSELMAEAPNRIMKLLGQLDDLILTMGESVQAMEDDRAAVARRQARDSLAQANRIVIGLLTEAQMQSSSGGGGGGGGSSSPEQSLSERLQQMAQEQAGLNGVTDELRRLLADRGISQQARSQMQRLGERQAEMAGRMGELAEAEREQPEGERLLGDLAEMGRDMERVGREIEEGLVSDETLARQERILSRMLDARNSVRRRDYTNRRESQTAQRLYQEQAGRQPGDLADPEQPFRLRYQPLEQAPMEYRELVRRYFAAVDSLGRLEPPPAAAEAGEMP
jgi:hypothetical protein